MLLQELASLEAQLIQMRTASEQKAAQPQAENETVEASLAPAVPLSEETSGVPPVEIEQQYKRVQEKLRNLGPCPRPMMG